MYVSQCNENIPTVAQISNAVMQPHNNLPSYTDICIDGLPAYHQAVNKNVENSGYCNK